MAEPEPRAAKPTLVAIDPEKGQAGPPPAARTAPAPAAEQHGQGQGARRLLGLMLLVLLVAVLAAVAQTRRLGRSEARAAALSEQVLALETELSAAHAQISTYEMQRGRIRDAVSDLSERVLRLSELVGGEPPPAEPPREP